MNAFRDLAMRPPALSVAEASRLGREVFGLDGPAVDLGSHQDRNVRIGGHVLKIANASWATAELELQDAAMRHAAGRLPGVVPAPVSGAIAEVEHGGERLRLRALPYLPGMPLRTRPHLSPRTLRAAGELAGRVAAALATFDHRAADRTLQWDVRRAGEVVEAYASAIGDPGDRALAERAARALPGDLPEQVVHGDVTVWNVLADVDDAGRLLPRRVIDFGDCGRSWRAAECAVLAASVCAHQPARALQDAAAVVAGFHAALPLDADELAAMQALIAARAALSLAGGAHQAALDPGNGYVAEGLAIASRGLRAITAVPPPVAHTAFRLACGLEAPAHTPRPAGATVPWARPADVLELGVRSDPWPDHDVRDPAVTSGRSALGRWGERRLTAVEASLDEPATVHLAVDLFVDAGSPVLAPVAGEVADAAADRLGLRIDDATVLWLRGLEPAVATGRGVAAGELLGHTAAPPLSAQLAPEVIGVPPADVPPSVAPAWLAVCPDPGPLLGLGATAAPAPAPAATLARRAGFVARPQRLYYPETPPQIERGRRQWLYDVDGRPYLDFVNNVAIVGHSHPRVEAAAARQLRLLNTNTRFLYDAMGRFAERLVGLVPEPLDRVFFVSSGSEANELALRLARRAIGRDHAYCFEGCYHGWTAAVHETLEDSRRMRKLPRPTADAEQAAAALDHALAAVGGGGPAAFICEPFLGNSGGVALPGGFLDRLYAAVRAGGGVCIADEVQVGYGRLGHHFWAFEQQGVVPDIVTLAKATGNGHPVAAVITTAGIADEFARHEDLFASVGGGPVSCEVGLAVLDVLEDEQLQANARAVGGYLTSRLAPLVGELPLVHALHGMGLYRGLELRRADGAAARGEAPAICERLLELGAIVQPTGPEGNVLKLKPPLCVATADVDHLAAALEETLASGW